MTHTFDTSAWGGAAARILSAALRAVDPAEAVFRNLRRSGDELLVGGKAYDLRQFKRVFLTGAGKAGAPMARAAAQVLGERLAGGIVVVKEGYVGGAAPEGVEILEAGHPLPDERGVAGAARLLDLLEDTRPDDLVLCLISGGGSALLVSPAPGLTLADLQKLTSALLASGASIDEINTLRKHLDQVKGGQLARLAAPAQLATLILSDVVGDPLDVIASGPTVPDPTTFPQAQAVLDKYDIESRAPEPILRRLWSGVSGEIPETPKEGDPLFERVQNVIIGSNRRAAEAALAQASAEGFNTLLLTTYLQGEARQAGRLLGAIARQIAASGQPVARPACIVAGGETTVTLQGGGGLGGRNQELALSAALEIAGLPEIVVVTLATDGGDGPTDAAGAAATGETAARARSAGLNPQDYLARNDSYHFFDCLGDLLKPGPTLTNVNDLAFIFAP
jgi:hydroxypyruvate reductase